VRMKKTRVYLKKDADLKESIAEIFQDLRITDLKDKKVFVKPNMLRAAKPDEAVITNPQLISETVLHLLNAGAHVLVGDNSAPDRTSDELEIAEYCGFINASHGQFRNIGRYPKKLKRQNNMLQEVYVSREILDCDILMSLPKFKVHDLTTMSAAIKNHFGLIPGGLKPYVHSLFPKIDDFSRVLLEIYEIRPPDIIIVDCLNVIDARGKKFAPGLLIVGENGHAVDYTCALIAGINPYIIPTLKIAKDDGLFDHEDIEYIGELEKIKGFALPFRFPFRNSVVEFVAQILYRIWLSRVPVVNSALCSRCLSCENVCPKRALRNQVIDYNKCIKCYCCIEVCPNKAIRKKFKL